MKRALKCGGGSAALVIAFPLAVLLHQKDWAVLFMVFLAILFAPSVLVAVTTGF